LPARFAHINIIKCCLMLLRSVLRLLRCWCVLLAVGVR
jgi:hypothetical protein